MKLNSKFSIIVAITVLQLAIFTSLTISTSNRLQAMEHYRYVQAETQKELSELICFLDEVDYWGLQVNTLVRDWDEKTSGLTNNFEYLTKSRDLQLLGNDVIKNVSEVETLWNMFTKRFEPVSEIMADMNSVKLIVGEYTSTEGHGIRESYEKYPTNPKMIKLYDGVTKLHGQMEGIRRSYTTLSNIVNKNTILIGYVVAKRKSIFLWQTVIVSLLSSLFLVVLITLVTKNISKRIIKVKDMTSVLAKKDFTVSIKPEGSTEMNLLMKNINEMVRQINEFFNIVKSSASKAISSGYTITDSANSTAAATSEIDNNINNINIQFDQISNAVNTTVQTVSEMNNHIDTLVNNNSRQTSSIADTNIAVNEVVGTLSYLTNMAQERAAGAQEMSVLVTDGDTKISATVEILDAITKQLDEVHEVVTIINNVAEQTNLLSMNAAIESAHAGEAGKGFAVVAEEIRSLAEETSENASRIAEVISKIVGFVQNANNSSTEAAQAFSKVSVNANRVIDSFQEITQNIKQIDDQMLQIKYKSEETASAADEINKYCGNLSSRQKEIFTEVNAMNSLFELATNSLKSIKTETGDIVTKMQNVSLSSEENYKNMNELEVLLDEFKTKTDGIISEVSENTGTSEIISEDSSVEEL